MNDINFFSIRKSTKLINFKMITITIEFPGALEVTTIHYVDASIRTYIRIRLICIRCIRSPFLLAHLI